MKLIKVIQAIIVKMVSTESPLRVVLFPLVGYTALQFHKYTKFSWVMELLFVYLITAPYLHYEKKMMDVGIQTNTDTTSEVTKHQKGVNKMFYVSLMVGIMGYMMTRVF